MQPARVPNISRATDLSVDVPCCFTFTLLPVINQIHWGTQISMHISNESYCVFKSNETYEFFMTVQGVLYLAGFTELNIESNPKSPSHQLSC